MKDSKVQFLAKVSILGALAGIVMVFDFSLPFVPPFYKIDFSEVIVLLCGYALGPASILLCEALKILVNLILNGTVTMGIGELANYIMGISFVLPATFMYYKHKTKRNAITGLLLGILSLCIVSSIINYYVMLPVYAYFFDMPLQAIIDMGHAVNNNIHSLWTLILLGVIPFNLLKGGLSAIIILLIYKKVSPIIKPKTTE